MGSLPFQLGVKFAQLQKKNKILRSRPKKIPYYSGTASEAIPGQVAIKGAMRSQTLKVEEVMTHASPTPLCPAC